MKRILYRLTASTWSADMNDPIDNISDAERKKITEVVAEELSPVNIPKDHIKMRAPIIRPEQDIICLGIKYMAHAVEAGRYKQEAFGGERQYPIYFSKRVNEAVGDGEPVLDMMCWPFAIARKRTGISTPRP